MVAKLQILSGKKRGSVFDLSDGSEVDIGNRKSAQISIRDPWISYNHAKISAQSGRFFIEDLGSSNGTWINGEKIKRQELSGSAVIYFGKTKVKFLPEGEGAAVATTAAPAPARGKTKDSPWWDRVLDDGQDAGPGKAKVKRLQVELDDERKMRKALEKFLDLPKGATVGDAARAGELSKRVRELEKDLETARSAAGAGVDPVAIEAAVAEERSRTEKLRREHMSTIVELEGKVNQSESRVVDLERRLKEKSEQVKKDVDRAKDKVKAEVEELKAQLEEARKSASEAVASSGDEAAKAAVERAERLERDLDELREKAKASEERVEALQTELEDARAGGGGGGGEEVETIKSQLWAAVEEATKWKEEARKANDDAEDARAEADKWREDHAKVVQEIDEISMEQIDLEDELNAKIDDLSERLSKYEPVEDDDDGDAADGAADEDAPEDEG